MKSIVKGSCALCLALCVLGRVENYTGKDLSHALLVLCYINFLFVCFDFQNTVSLCSSGCPGPGSINQVSLKIRDHLPLPPECWK